MGVHWSEYPERVETFGELLSILETLDRHEMEHGFSAEWFDKERKRLTAYTVDFHNRQHQFHPNLDQMPGLERLLDHFAINGYPALTQRAARELRLQAAHALNRDAAALNAMTFTAIMDALKPAPPPTPAIRTFGDFLADVRAVEQCAAGARANVHGDEPGSGYWRIQAAVYEATAEYRKHPSFPHLEAHVNRVYGDFTSANLLRLRGEVCALRHCGTREVDELPVEAVAALLNCPGTEASADVPKPTEQRVDTTPSSKEPPGSSVDEAMCALPSVLNNEPELRYFHDPMKRRGAEYAILRQRMQEKGHQRDAAEWAIHRHVEAGRLDASPRRTSGPVQGWLDGGSMMPLTNRLDSDRERCLLWANESLWEWWKNERNPEAAPQPTDYTMADIRALLVYEREMAKFEADQRALGTSTSVAALHNRVMAAALNTPISPRLALDRAFGIAVFRQLSVQSENIFRRPLDERGLLHFIGEVADRQQQPLEVLLAQPVARFEELWNAPAQKQPLPAQQVTATNQANRTEGKTPQTGGRPKLGEGPKATKQDKALRNVYELVRRVLQPGMGAKALKAHFSKDKDFRARVAEAGREFDDALFRAARARGSTRTPSIRKPSQETFPNDFRPFRSATGLSWSREV